MKKHVVSGLFVTAAVLLSGCLDEAVKKSDDRDHALRPQVDLMRDAQSVTETLNGQTKEQDEKAAELTGH